MWQMFYGASSFNQDRRLNTSSVNRMDGMFQNAWSFNGSINNWDTRQVTQMGTMFQSASNFNQNIGIWNTSNVISMRGMFKFASSFNQNLGDWNSSKVTDMYQIFYSTTSLSGENKGLIHATFTLNSNWPYDWSEFLPNQAPQFQTDGNLSVLENETLVYEFNATDTDGDALSYTIQPGLDAQFFLNESNGILTSDNIYELTASVSDGHESAIINLHVSVEDGLRTRHHTSKQMETYI